MRFDFSISESVELSTAVRVKSTVQKYRTIRTRNHEFMKNDWHINNKSWKTVGHAIAANAVSSAVGFLSSSLEQY
jgi:hypothetical protein